MQRVFLADHAENMMHYREGIKRVLSDPGFVFFLMSSHVDENLQVCAPLSDIKVESWSFLFGINIEAMNPDFPLPFFFFFFFFCSST